jgi:ATP-binding cassette subfamily C protein
MGRSVLDSINALDEISETARIARLRLAEEGFVNQTLQGIDLLTGAVTGAIAVPHNDYDGQSSAVTAASITVTHAGFILSEENRERADAQIASGRQVFAAVAQACGARVRAIDLGDTWWHQEGPPLVAQTRDDSYVSLLWSGHSWTLTDPAEPLVPREVDEESRARLSGRAWEFLPDLGPKPTNIRSLIQLAFTRSRRDLTVIGVLTAGIAALAFFTPYVFGQLAGSFATTDSTDTRGVITALTALFMRMRSTWHDKFSLGERMTQSTAVTLSASAVPDVAIVGLLDTAVVLGGLAAIATTNGALLAAVTIFLVIQFAVNFWLTRVGARLTAKRVAALSHTQGRLVETLRAVNRIKVSGAQGRAFRRWSILQADLTRADLALRRITIIQTLVIGAWPVIGLILIVFISGISGATFGDFVTAQTALGIATTTLATTAFSASQLANGRAILSAVKPVLEAVPEGTQDGADPGRIQGGVSFSEIVFRYSPETAPVLNGVSFTVQPGEHVAVVGPSGCGKTTLMRILLGLEDPESGVIAVDGQDLSVLDRPSFRRQVGSVLQSSTLLPGSIRDNVDMGRGLTMSEIWQALEWACVADDVREMGMGLETPVVDGGGTVSGGQRQRILLARALACNPRMLVLDEATSALDNVTQGSIVDYLENLRLTRIVIAHRLSTIRTADRIIVIAGGRVAQQGTFEELTAQPGHFADLVKRQVV